MKLFRFQYLLILLYLFPLGVQAIEWHDTKYGKWTVTHFEHSPFPTEDSSEAAFNDNSVFIFIPAGYIKKDFFDLIVEHHGHGAIITPHNEIKLSYPEKIRQCYQLFESRKNAILVMPQAAYNKASGAAGKFAEPSGFERFLSELTLFLKNDNVIFSDADIRQIHISSFSGGYNITAMDITQNSPELVQKIKSINLWDSFYGQEEIYFDWVLNNERNFFSTYTPTGGTVSLNRLLADSLKSRAMPFDSIYGPINKIGDRFIQYTHRSHGNVARGEFSYERYLQRLPLEDLDIRPPLLLSAIGNDDGIDIHWAEQMNPHLKGYQLYYSKDGNNWDVLAGMDELRTGATSFFHKTDRPSYYRLQAISDLNTKIDAPFNLMATPGKEISVLLIHAENRRLSDNNHGFDPDSFLSKINPELISNIGQNLDIPFSSCSNFAIRRGMIKPDQFDYVLWLGGEENIQDKLIDYSEKTWLQYFLAQGGNLLISGTGVSADLASVYTSPEDRKFGETIAGVSGTDSIQTEKNLITIAPPLMNEEFDLDGDFPVNLAFKYTLLPVIFLDTTYPIASLYKYATKNSKTSTTLTLSFSLALTKNGDMQRYILDQFFEYAKAGENTPSPPRLSNQIYVRQDTIHTIWPDETETIIGLIHNNKKSITDTVIYHQSPIISEMVTDSAQFVRLQAQSGNMISRPSELLGSSQIKRSRGRILIVNGYDRLTAENTFDYCIEHGISFNQLNYDFDTATNETVISGMVDLTDYELVDWMVGEESTTNQTFDSIEQRLITEYINMGGRIIISGSEIGWDLVEKATCTSDSMFFSSVLGAGYMGDNAESSKFIMNYNENSQNDTLKFGITYSVYYPDILSANENSEILLKYDTNQTAAVGKRNPNGGASVLVAFPLETVAPVEKRTEVFRYLLDYLLN
jgi:hypothetical protein